MPHSERPSVEIRVDDVVYTVREQTAKDIKSLVKSSNSAAKNVAPEDPAVLKKKIKQLEGELAQAKKDVAEMQAEKEAANQAKKQK